jgi:hypothetical protein
VSAGVAAGVNMASEKKKIKNNKVSRKANYLQKEGFGRVVNLGVVTDPALVT